MNAARQQYSFDVFISLPILTEPFVFGEKARARLVGQGHCPSNGYYLVEKTVRQSALQGTATCQ